MVEKVESKIVSGTGVAVNGRDKEASRKVQDAMENAIKEANKAGVTDHDEIKKRMHEARMAAKR